MSKNWSKKLRKKKGINKFIIIKFQSMEQNATSSQQGFKTASLLMLIVGLINFALAVMLYNAQEFISWQFVLTILFAFILIGLSFPVRNHNFLALKIILVIWIAIMVEELTMLIITRNPLFVVSILYKLAILVFLVAPLPSVQAEVEKVKRKNNI